MQIQPVYSYVDVQQNSICAQEADGIRFSIFFLPLPAVFELVSTSHSVRTKEDQSTAALGCYLLSVPEPIESQIACIL